MKTFLAVGILTLTAGAAAAAYLVELESGERMTVESYWEDGDKVHLNRGGVDLIVPKSSLKSVRSASDDALPDARPSGGGSAPAPVAAATPPTGEEAPIRRSDSTDPEEVRRDLERQREDIERQLLRAQAARFEAAARGDDPKDVKRLEGAFKHQQQRRIEVNRELKALDGN